MIIKRKLNALQLLEEFESIADFDYDNGKYYFVFEDKDRDGNYTLMKKDDKWSIHGKGKNYCDIDETVMSDLDELVDFIWKHRSKINQSLKLLEKDAVSV